MQTYTILNDNNENYLLYFHGGGYLIGDKNDLPKPILNYLKRHFNVILINYPLAPYSKFESIIEFSHKIINEILVKFEIENYIFLGRSSGSNLILSLDKNCLIKKPKAILNFYGYPSLDLEWTTQPIRGVKNIKPVYFKKKEDFTLSRDTTTYYPYYAYARQSGAWPELIQISEKPITYSNLTPLFTVHSIFDPDVPYKATLKIDDYFQNKTKVTSTLPKHAIDHDPTDQKNILRELEGFIDHWRLQE